MLVFVGGGLGSVLRWGAGLAAVRLWGAGFPCGTLFVNLLGGLVIGLLARQPVLLTDGGSAPRLLLITGVLGGFTTFSAFSLDAVTLAQAERFGAALGYVLLSVLGSPAACAAGLWLGGVVAR